MLLILAPPVTSVRSTSKSGMAESGNSPLKPKAIMFARPDTSDIDFQPETTTLKSTPT